MYWHSLEALNAMYFYKVPSTDAVFTGLHRLMGQKQSINYENKENYKAIVSNSAWSY